MGAIPQPRTWRCGGRLHVVQCAVPCIVESPFLAACNAPRQPSYSSCPCAWTRVRALKQLVARKKISFSIDYAKGARNGHPFLRKGRNDKYRFRSLCQSSFRSTPPTSFLISTTQLHGYLPVQSCSLAYETPHITYLFRHRSRISSSPLTTTLLTKGL
jgi:hypothetical protein